MKKYILSIVLLTNLSLVALGQQPFVLKGETIHVSSPYVYLGYRSGDGSKHTLDSVKIEHNTFVFKGTIEEPVMAGSMDAFVRHIQGEPVMIADAEQGLVIQQLVAALYESSENGERVALC